LPNLQGLHWQQQGAGYLAGVVAASISESGHIAAIGREDSPWITNYMIGFRNGAHSVNPTIKVELPYLPAADSWENQYDPAAGKDVTEKLLAASPDIDVVFQVAGGGYDAGGYQPTTTGTTGAGILEAACAKSGVHAIGLEVDQHLSLAADPAATKCLVTSAMKSFATSVSNAIVRVSDGTAVGGTIDQNLTNAGVDIAPFYDFQSLITPDIQATIDAAKAGLKDGTIRACVEDGDGDCVSPAPAG
jgi:basic membrane protein A